MNLPTKPSLPLRLRPSRAKLLLWLAFCIGFVAIGILMVRDGQAMGWFCGGAFAFGALVFGIRLHPQAAYLHFTSESCTFCSLFRAHFVAWVHVREFAVIGVGPRRMVAWNFIPDHPATGRARGLSKVISGYEAALPDTYGLAPTALAELLDGRRWQYAGLPPL